MAFWGIEVSPGKTFTTTLEAPLVVSNASFGTHVKKGDRAVLWVKVGDAKAALCSLRPGHVEHANISLELDPGTKVSFAMTGESPIHVSGFYTDKIGSDDEDSMSSSSDDTVQYAPADDKKVKHQPKVKVKRSASTEEEEDKPAKKKARKNSDGEANLAEMERKRQELRARQQKLEAEKKKAEEVARKKEEAKKGGVRLGVEMRHPSGLVYKDIKEGMGKKAVKGKRVSVHYTGKLQKNGRVFDSSRKRRQPFSFHLGRGEVIRGWDVGVEGMMVGQKRVLTIPAKLGYGARGAPPDIPGGATLVFDVELMGVSK